MKRIKVNYSFHTFTQKGWLEKNRENWERSEDRRKRCWNKICL